MKWIGQHIWSLISRFRSDVYLEDISTGTIASGGNLGLDSNNKIVKATVSGGGGGTATDITVADESSDTTCFPLFVTAATGDLAPKTDSQLTYNSSSGELGCGALDTNTGAITCGAIGSSSSGSFQGTLSLESSNNDGGGPTVNLIKTRGGSVAAVDDDEIGDIRFKGENSTGTEEIYYSRIQSTISEADDTDEAGKLVISVAASDGSTSSLNPGLTLEGEHATGNEVDAIIGNGTASTTTIAGTLKMGTTPAMTNAGLLSVGNQTGITGVGTISSGTWNGTAIASNYLDPDTAHLSGIQTFLGPKTFEAGIVLDGNRNATPGDGAMIHVDAADITDNNTSASGTATAYNHVSIENPRILASNALVTTTDASTLQIKGAPVASTNQTITNAWALKVTAGNCKFGGDLDVVGNVLPGITYVKILPSDFIPDDAGRPIMIDDTTSGRWLESHTTAKMFASVQIPIGFKATHVDIYGDSTSQVTVYEADIDSAVVTSKGTGNIGTQIDITDVTADATNYILIQLAQASGEKVYGGKLTIAKA